MVFRTAGAIATVLIGVTGQALAQYYPPPQAYPRPPVPPTVNTDELPPLNAPVVQGDLLPPVGVGPAYQAMPGARDQSGTGGLEAAIKALVAVVLALGTLLVAVKKLIF